MCDVGEGRVGGVDKDGEETGDLYVNIGEEAVAMKSWGCPFPPPPSAEAARGGVEVRSVMLIISVNLCYEIYRCLSVERLCLL